MYVRMSGFELWCVFALQSSGLKVTLPMYWQKCQDALCAMERVQAVALHQRGSVKVCVSGGTATAGRGNQVS